MLVNFKTNMKYEYYNYNEGDTNLINIEMIL